MIKTLRVWAVFVALVTALMASLVTGGLAQQSQPGSAANTGAKSTNNGADTNAKTNADANAGANSGANSKTSVAAMAGFRADLVVWAREREFAWISGRIANRLRVALN